ncbi:hypothetical protein OIU91_19905 [Streptomyces sp. NBC_01456]|uniref:DUF6624 domain-containing protein n=1 Tax=Streptomyces sp. NBC_01456 TaxID=2975868 RepID=UPI002E36DCD5|nr:DUF6624 domain-containing protein [Streptomyces sp. NBC_01456]
MPDPTQTQQPDLAEHLLRRMAANQYARGVRPNGTLACRDVELMRTVDTDNTAALQRIIDKHGWPGLSLVGQQAANAAWLITQHAGLDFQLRALDLIRDAVEHGEAASQHLAILTDRVLIQQEQPQLYGTQYLDRHDGRGYQLWEVFDPDNLDARRAEVGLGPAAYDPKLRIRH